VKIPRSLTRFRRGDPEAVVEREPEPTAENVTSPEPEPEPAAEPAIALVPPPPEPRPAPEPEPEPLPAVVPLALRDPTPRSWNLWDLERLANREPASEERRLLLLHLRQFADPSGDLPVEFDPLVRDAFGAGLAGLAR
jgi:hypothetical protein